MAGAPYAAGGINVTIEATRAATDDELLAAATARLRRGAPGRHHDDRDQDRLRRHGRRRGPAGARGRRADRRGDVPRRPRRARRRSTPTTTSSLVTGPMLSAVAPHARWIDAFCERGAFDADQCRAVLHRRPRRRARTAAARQPARPRSRRPAGRRARLRVGRSLHLPERRRRRRPGRQRHGGDVPAGHRLLDPPAVPGRPSGDRCRCNGRPGDQLQPGLELHDVDVVRHRPRRPRPAHDGDRGADRGDPRRRPRPAP